GGGGGGRWLGGGLGGRCVRVADVGNGGCAGSFPALAEEEAPPVPREVGGTRAVEPGKVGLLRLSPGQAPESCARAFVREEQAARGGHIVQDEARGGAQDHPLVAPERYRAKGLDAAPVGGGEPDLLARGRPGQP